VTENITNNTQKEIMTKKQAHIREREKETTKEK